MPQISLAQAEDGARQIITSGRPDWYRKACLDSLWFLLVYACGRIDLKRQFFLDRCQEVQDDPDGYLDLWAREHGKSSIITFGLTLRDILANPELTVGVFSHTRPNAKGFLSQLKRELETNAGLKELFPDVLWQNPTKEAPSWSLDAGIIVRRKDNPKEATVEAHGLVDGQPIGKHFGLMVYDDVVVPESVTTPEMRTKTLQMLELSYNLGSRGGRRRAIGTRYHYQDAYRVMIDRGTFIPRIHRAEEDGVPVLLTREELAEKRRDMGPYTFGAQMMLDPKGDDSVGFRREWLRYWSGQIGGGNRYILVDPANKKRKQSDYTAAWVIELCEDENYYVRDLVRSRLNLKERIDLVIALHRRWKPRAVAYESYGLQADIEAIQMEQSRTGYRFPIQEVGGQVSKFDRIMRLTPLCAAGRLYLPQAEIWTTDDEGRRIGMVNTFIDHEYLAWPYAPHDDMLDALSRIMDVQTVAPRTGSHGMDMGPIVAGSGFNPISGRPQPASGQAGWSPWR